MDKIDFVVLWVDGSDPAWLEEKNRYSSGAGLPDSRPGNAAKQGPSDSDNRYRDWDNMRCWFRAVEKFAPWVNRVFFVTWGHLPPWLNTDNPKLRIVKHSEFIPPEYLPTFHSDTIETNLFRIEDLSEQFVLFNDDMFLTAPVKPEDFFVDGKIRDSFVESLIAPVKGGIINHTRLVMTDIINANFKKRLVHRKLRTKIYSPKNGLQNLITLYFAPFGYFTGFRNPHIALSHLKSTFSEVWDAAENQLDSSCRNRFRTTNDVSHWLMRYWNLCSGRFVPRDVKFGRYFEAGDDNRELCDAIRNQRVKTVCINDMSKKYDFEKAKAEINGALEAVLPEKCSFEKPGA